MPLTGVRAVLRLRQVDPFFPIEEEVAAIGWADLFGPRFSPEVYGTEVRLAPRALCLIFDDPVQALDCALDLCCLRGEEVNLSIGGHVDMPGVSDDVPVVAERLSEVASRPQILLTRGMADLLRTSDLGPSAKFAHICWWRHGKYEMRDLPQPVEVFEVGLQGLSSWNPPREGEEACRLEDEETPGWRPSCGQELPDSPDWRLLEFVGKTEVGEKWIGIHLRTFKRRVFQLIFNRRALGLLRHRTLWLYQLRGALRRCKRLIRVRDYNLEGKVPFIAMAQTSAESLADRVDLLRSSLFFRLDIVAQVADALAVAHNSGVIHGGLSPRNILVKVGSNGSPRVYLTDFALPRNPGSVGQRLYGLPGSNPDVASMQSDFYAFAVLFYQIVCGDLSRPLSRGWERNVVDDTLIGAITSATNLFSSGAFRSLRAVSEVLRGTYWDEEKVLEATWPASRMPGGWGW